jgi:hypothetical protein
VPRVYFAKRGDFLPIEYCFNPVVAGFPDTAHAAWRGNPWHSVTGEGLFDKMKGVVK